MSDFEQQPSSTPASSHPNLTAGPALGGGLMPPGYMSPFWGLMSAGPSPAEHPDEHGSALVPPPVTGNAGALGREALVQTQSQRAYDAGLHAPHVDYNGPLYRTVPNNRWSSYVNHLFTDQGGGRYNAPGNRILYGSSSATENVGEMAAYAKPGHHPMENNTQVELNYNAHVDPATGRGGVADISGHLNELGLSRAALTEPKGGGGAHRTWLSRLTGEDPYLHTRALGQGVVDSGASGMRVPSATGGNQINPIPVNTDPQQLQYRQHVDFDGHGNPGPVHADPAHLSQHAPGSSGPGVMPDGHAPIPVHNKLNPTHAEHFTVEQSPGRTQRAGSTRYAAGGAALASLGGDLYDRFVGHKDVSVGDMAGHAAANTGVATLGSLANDRLLTPRLGGGLRGAMKGGAVVDAVTSGLFSTWDNAAAYREGRENAGQATANVAVDTGVGVGAGLAGAAAGAAIGSVIPIAGTAVGAGVGFLAGMAGSYLARTLADKSGFTDWAKRGLGGALQRFNRPLGKAWDGISSATNWMGNTASNAWHGAGNALSNTGHAIANTASNAWNGATTAASNTGHAIANTASNVWNGATTAASSAGRAIGNGARGLWHALKPW